MTLEVTALILTATCICTTKVCTDPPRPRPAISS
jgi:hypothetical protein